MAYDIGLAQLMRDDLGDTPSISEKKMFGGLAYMYRGHMLCGVHKDGAMYRVGPDNFAAAKSIEGARDMMFTGRAMTGFIDVEDDTMADDEKRHRWLAMALEFVSSLPDK